MDSKGRERKAELSVLYRFHGILTDKKLSGTITPKEERVLAELEKIEAGLKSK